MPLVVIHDVPVSFEFSGEVIARVSTRENAAGRQRVRWFTAVLYRKDDGSDGYVLHQANWSRVWHLDEYAGDHVRKPGAAEHGELPGNAVYCGSLDPRDRQCPPGSRQGPPLPPGTAVVTELPQHKVTAYPDADAVIRGVLTTRRGEGSVSVALSDPMGELMDEAAENDPPIAAARPVIRLLRILFETANHDQETAWRTRHWLTGWRTARGCRRPRRIPKMTTRRSAGATCGQGWSRPASR